MKITKRQLKKIIKEERQKILTEIAMGDMDKSSVTAMCKESFEHDTLFKVQGVILEAYPSCDTGDIAEMHIASTSFGRLDFEQLSDLVCEWMIDYADACSAE